MEGVQAEPASHGRTRSGVTLVAAGVVAAAVLYLPFVGMAWTAYAASGWSLSGIGWALVPLLAGGLVAFLAHRRRRAWTAVAGAALIAVGLTSIALLLLGWVGALT